jgi:hypothetical protein
MGGMDRQAMTDSCNRRGPIGPGGTYTDGCDAKDSKTRGDDSADVRRCRKAAKADSEVALDLATTDARSRR